MPSTSLAAYPSIIKIDNLKSAILEANFYEPLYQELYRNFADYYGFHPLPCRVKRPNDKGKVESGIKYVKGNFFAGCHFKDEYDLQQRLKKWNQEINQLIHGTTYKVPQEVFETEEKAQLLPLPQEEFAMTKVGIHKVYHDCHIYADYNYYSFPFYYVGKKVEISLAEKLLKISHKGGGIATHPHLSGRGNFSTCNCHYPAYELYCETEYQEKYQAKMAQIGIYSEQLFFLILKEHPRDWHRPVAGIITLKKHYSPKVIETSCKRGLHYGITQYLVIKNICHNGSYLLSLEEAIYAEC